MAETVYILETTSWKLIDDLMKERATTREALHKLANPTHHPKGLEATLLQDEVIQIAKDALNE